MQEALNKTDVAVIGASLGGVSATIAALKRGATVTLVAAHHWLGGQLTVQGVPLDEHPWADTGLGSSTYQELRSRIRHYYRRNFPVTHSAMQEVAFNPGQGNISTLTHEPSVAAAVLEEMLQPWLSSGKLRLLRRAEVTEAEVRDNRIVSLGAIDDNGSEFIVAADTFVDATELGDVLPLVGADHVIGAESRSDTGELHALDVADPLEQQAVTWCFAVDFRHGEDHTISRPAQYERWRNIQIPSWPGPQFSWVVSDHVTHEPRERPLLIGEPGPEWAWDLWHARRIFSRFQFDNGFADSDVTLANWPQMDYWSRPFLAVSDEEHNEALVEAKELSRSFLYWMQTEAPRWEGGHGYPELRLRPDALGTNDGFAMEPYFRDSRRLLAEFRVVEEHIGVEARGKLTDAERFDDTVGIGAYRIDIHPSTRERNTVDIDTHPYQIPLGSLLSRNVENLLAGCKNIGTTRVTNGAYRVHPTEWNIGEAAGSLASFCKIHHSAPAQVRNQPELLRAFQNSLVRNGVDLEWPTYGALTPTSRNGWREN
ncbi:MAG: FAD-dependent oxidoreductase [Micrococcaceae bacterium]